MATIETFRTAFRTERATVRPRPPRTPLLVHAGRAAGRLVTLLPRLRTAAFSIGGLAGITAGAFQVHTGLGLAAGGLSLLVLEYLTSDSGPR